MVATKPNWLNTHQSRAGGLNSSALNQARVPAEPHVGGPVQAREEIETIRQRLLKNEVRPGPARLPFRAVGACKVCYTWGTFIGPPIQISIVDKFGDSYR
jgi:hypothetical protein